MRSAGELWDDERNRRCIYFLVVVRCGLRAWTARGFVDARSLARLFICGRAWGCTYVSDSEGGGVNRICDTTLADAEGGVMCRSDTLTCPTLLP